MNEESLFSAALDKPAAERQGFLDEACAGDARLRQRVEKLLAANERPPGVLDPDREGDFVLGTPPSERLLNQPRIAEGPGDMIGSYKLKELIGEGGFGLVFIAEQQQPIRRKVALKIIKPGMDTRDVIARFEAERQALALMEHPNIAHVLDGGATESGRPYFVMELVRGVAITEYCDQQQLTTRARLDLFTSVCHAVQHAHQKGIIHRDLKPSNILVTLQDSQPVVKVIDFGVAKALNQQLTDRSIYTLFAQMIGTPTYMSPEQAEMSGLDVDTRSDIYALGVLLYELLTGSTPFDRTRLATAGYDEIRRIIREVEPDKPSTRLSHSKETIADVAARRKTEPAKLTQLIRGELDWIVMKALEKDRTRRYETANDFARDVQRYLADEAVEASPPSNVYRVRKFVRRNRRSVLATTLIFLLLIAGMVGTTVGLLRAEERAEGERLAKQEVENARQAEAARADGEQRAKETAQQRLSQLEKAIDLLASIFDDLDPWAEAKEGRPLRAILGDRLDQVAAELEGDALGGLGGLGDPLHVAKLQARLGRTYLSLGHFAKAESLLSKCAATCTTSLGAEHRTTLHVKYHLAQAYGDLGRRPEAIALYEQVRDSYVRTLGADHADTLSVLGTLGWTYYLAAKRKEALVLLEQVRDARVKQLGPEHPLTIDALNNLASVYAHGGRTAEAIELLEKVREARIKQFGADHPETLRSINNLANVYMAGMKMRLALELLEQARDSVVPKLGEDHPQTLTTLNNLAWIYRAFGRNAEAIELGERVRAKRILHLGAYHPSTLLTLENLAMAYRADGKPEQALPLFQQAAAGVEKLQFAMEHGDRIVQGLCRCHEQLKQYEQAEAWRRKLLPVLKAQPGPESPKYAAELLDLGSNLLKQNKHAAAEPILRECLALVEKQQPQAFGTFRIQSMLGAALLGQQKHAEAEPLLVQGYEGMKKSAQKPGHGGSTGERLVETLERLVQLYDAWNKPQEASKWRKELEATKPAANRAG